MVISSSGILFIPNLSQIWPFLVYGVIGVRGSWVYGHFLAKTRLPTWKVSYRNPTKLRPKSPFRLEPYPRLNYSGHLSGHRFVKEIEVMLGQTLQVIFSVLLSFSNGTF